MKKYFRRFDLEHNFLREIGFVKPGTPEQKTKVIAPIEIKTECYIAHLLIGYLLPL